MEPSASPSVDTELRRLQAELATLQAGQVAEVARLRREVAQAQAERAAALAQAGQRAAEVARLREEVATLRRELGAHHQPEATGPRASARPREWPPRGATGEGTRPRGPLAVLGAQQEALGEEPQPWHHGSTHGHRRPEDPGDTGGPLPVSPSPEDAHSPLPGGTRTQESTGGFKPFLLFVLASAIIFLHPCLKQS